MIKMVNIDLDGTLLNNEGKVSERAIENFKKSKEKNIEIVITSGRPPKSTLSIAEETGASRYIIAGNGAIVYDKKEDISIFNGYLTQEKVLEIIEMCEKHSIYYNVYTQNDILTKTLEYNILFYYKENIFKPNDKKTNINVVEDIRKYIIDNNISEFLKITVCDKSKIIFQNILRKLREIQGIDVLDVAHMSKKIIKEGTKYFDVHYCYTEISREGINKWTAIKELANHLNISEKEILTIGDNINDYEMVKNAGIGVAMENGSPKVKEVAAYITKNNQEDGVALAIEKYVLNDAKI
ncbi:MAG: Cof-type HAD-IIB family hydrolase [Clostridium sp.]